MNQVGFEVTATSSFRNSRTTGSETKTKRNLKQCFVKIVLFLPQPLSAYLGLGLRKPFFCGGKLDVQSADSLFPAGSLLFQPLPLTEQLKPENADLFHVHATCKDLLRVFDTDGLPRRAGHPPAARRSGSCIQPLTACAPFRGSPRRRRSLLKRQSMSRAVPCGVVGRKQRRQPHSAPAERLTTLVAVVPVAQWVPSGWLSFAASMQREAHPMRRAKQASSGVAASTLPQTNVCQPPSLP